jgi:hypothetical protein
MSGPSWPWPSPCLNNMVRAVTEALRQLDQATTAARTALDPAQPTEDEWRPVERATGINRGWDAAYRLASTLDPPGQGRARA